jgi:hypothetical protein
MAFLIFSGDEYLPRRMEFAHLPRRLEFAHTFSQASQTGLPTLVCWDG